MRGADLNPIRFRVPADAPDNLTVFPNHVNTTFGEVYFFGVSASPSFIRSHTGELYLQFLNTANAVQTLTVYKLGDDGTFAVDSTIDSVDISPVGWTGYQIHKITLDLGDGIYYTAFGNAYKSDYFRITTDIEYTEDLVKITYLNSVNDFGCIFGANSFTSYFIGKLVPGEPKTEIESYEDDRGIPIKLKASPQKTATLTIYEVQSLYKHLIEMIFSCDTITVNGIAYENTEAPTFSDIENSDISTCTIKLVQTSNDYYHG